MVDHPEREEDANRSRHNGVSLGNVPESSGLQEEEMIYPGADDEILEELGSKHVHQPKKDVFGKVIWWEAHDEYARVTVCRCGVLGFISQLEFVRTLLPGIEWRENERIKTSSRVSGKVR
jgi:hypothetical protein